MTKLAQSSKAMIATSHPEAVRAGAEVLRSGGNAIDAAIAANAVLGVAEPHMCGVGGDIMAMMWDAKTSTLTGLVGAGRSPASFTLESYRERGLDHIPTRHPLTWTSPGCVEGWMKLLDRWGTRSLADLLQPAIALAERGCSSPIAVTKQWQTDPLKPWPEAQRVFLPDGKPPEVGEVRRNPDLAQTLRKIGEDWTTIYRGEIAERIAAFAKANGGMLTVDDLSAHESEWVTPLSTDYRGTQVFGLPMPTQAPTVLQILNLLEHEDLAAMGWGSAEATHCMVEAKKFAYEDRARWIHDHMGKRRDLEAAFVSKDHARTRWQGFDPAHALKSIPFSTFENSNTVYVSVVDEAGNAVSLIQSIYWVWGSGAVPDGLGFCLQNRGADFSLDPNHPCCAAPRKRPLHTIIPGFAMREGQPWLCFGVVGGPMQPQGQVQVLTNLIDFGMDVQAAGAAPRWRHDGSSDVSGAVICDGGTVFLEAGFPADAAQGLHAKGHSLGDIPFTFGGYQGILIDRGRGALMGGSDPRKDGFAMGI